MKKSDGKGKTALYVRVSTDAQYEEGYSVEVQSKKLVQYCQLHDIENYELFVDGGFSGSNLRRPEMKRLIEEISQGSIENVIVYKLDRLSRSQKDTIYLLEDVFQPAGTGFISLNESFDTTTPYGKAMIGILSVFAQLERENIRERTRMGMNERLNKGYWRGSAPPFGYDYDSEKNILVPNADSQKVRQIFELYSQGCSTTRLAELFGFGSDKQICDILDRKTYIGIIVNRDREIRGLHQPIITERLWNEVSAQRKKRRVKKEYNSDYLLSGLIYCGKCGAKMRYQKWGKSGVKVYCYSQQKSRKNLIKDPNCDNLRVDACDIEDVVIKDILSLSMEHSKNENADNGTDIVRVYQNKLNETKNKLKRLYALYAANENDENDILLSAINDLKQELDSIMSRLDFEEKKRSAVKEKSRRHKMIENIADGWGLMTNYEKQRLVREIVDKVVFTDGRVDIYYNL